MTLNEIAERFGVETYGNECQLEIAHSVLAVLPMSAVGYRLEFVGEEAWKAFRLHSAEGTDEKLAHGTFEQAVVALAKRYLAADSKGEP